MKLLKPQSFKHYFAVIVICNVLSVVAVKQLAVVTTYNDLYLMFGFYLITACLGWFVAFNYGSSLFERKYKLGGCIMVAVLIFSAIRIINTAINVFNA